MKKTRCATGVKMPTYSSTKGWHGGDRKALYAFVDVRTKRVHVRPVYDARGVGPKVRVRLATAAEARKALYPVGTGWKVRCK